MSDGFTLPPDALREAVEGIRAAVADAARAGGTMSAALLELGRLVPGTRTAAQAAVLARTWRSDVERWSEAAEALGDLLEETAADIGLTDGELARLLGEAW
ncbi:hypothetical protein [Actinomycetospora termitidis]|uniref:Uncharacterized protein n=1 Tax=Actinomycetospora termitidis TaxID=3053470 RepID=A0ABT7M2A5_9PSEU|nr:hypothetical protein [Actinomycetospora sp. Odt1-22]MDL5154793.1 hypothetical protein [Actinomycetospora sp. Odt1-22]